MSGGFYEYQQGAINRIAEAIEAAINNKDSYIFDDPRTETELKKAVVGLRIAYAYAQNVDLLLSGDFNEQTFHRRLKKELTAARTYKHDYSTGRREYS